MLNVSTLWHWNDFSPILDSLPGFSNASACLGLSQSADVINNFSDDVVNGQKDAGHQFGLYRQAHGLEF